jgi:putative ABC transport system substrate-binding protein
MTRRRDVLAVAPCLVLSRAARAQPTAPPRRIAFLALVPGEDATLMPALLERLHELGYVEGRTMSFEYRSAEGRPERLPALAAELLRAGPDLLITGFGTLAAQAAQAATATVPIVFTNVGDPVGAGLVASLARPGGNVTGLTDQARDLQGKRLQLLEELRPGGAGLVVAALLNPDTPYAGLALQELRAAARASLRTRLLVLEARTADEVRAGVEAAARGGAAGLLVFEDPLTYSARRRIAELASGLRLPTLCGYREFAEAGALMSYGTDRRRMYRRAAEYADRILRGAKPADLAVEQPTRFELVINLSAARAIGIELPTGLLARADEVIE